MNHLESTFTGKNNFWRYIVVFAIIFIVTNTIGSLPLILVTTIKSVSDPEIFTTLSDNPGDLRVLGLDPNTGLLLMLFPFIAGLIAFILVVKPLHNRSFKCTINGTGNIRWKRFFISALIWLTLSSLYLFTSLKSNPANFTLNNKSFSLVILIIISVIFIPFQAAFEEVLFRGYLMQGFVTVMRNRWFPLVVTSVLFGMMHAFNPEVKEFGFMIMIPQYILFGLVFGVVTILDDGIEAAMGAHAANNAFLCIMVTNKSSALQTPALFAQQNISPWTEFAGLIFIGVVFILILKVVFKWNDFSILFSRVNTDKIEAQIP